MDQGSTSSSLLSTSKLYVDENEKDTLKSSHSNARSLMDECSLSYEEILKKISIAVAEKIASNQSSLTDTEPDYSFRDYLLNRSSHHSQIGKPSTQSNQIQSDSPTHRNHNINPTRVHFNLHPVSSVISFTDSDPEIQPDETELPAQSPSPSTRPKPILLPPPIPSKKPTREIQFPRPFRRRLSIDLKALETSLPPSPPPQEIPLPDSPKPEFDFSEFENCLNQVGLNLLDNLPMMIEKRSQPSVVDYDCSKPLIDLEAPTESPHKTYTYPDSNKPSQKETKTHQGNFSPLPSPTLPFFISSLVSSPITDSFSSPGYKNLDSVVLSPNRSGSLDLNDHERYVPVNEMFASSKQHQARSPRKDKRSVAHNEEDGKSTSTATIRDQSQSKSRSSTPTRAFKRQPKSPLQIIPTVASLWTSTSTVPSPIESLHTPVECCHTPIDSPHTPIESRTPIEPPSIPNESNKSSRSSTPIGPCTCSRSDASTVNHTPTRNSSAIHQADFSPLSAPFDHTEHHERENEASANPTSPYIPNPPLPPSPIPTILSDTCSRSSALKELIKTISKRSKEREKELEEMIKISIEREEEFERLVKLMKEREQQRDEVLMNWACRVPLPIEDQTAPIIRCSNVQAAGEESISEHSNRTYNHSTHNKSPSNRSIHSTNKAMSIRSYSNMIEPPLLSPKAASIHSFKTVQREPSIYSPIAQSIRSSASIHSPLGVNAVHSPRALSVHSNVSRPKSVNDSIGHEGSPKGPVSVNSAGVESPVGIFKSPGNRSIVDSLLLGNHGGGTVDDNRSMKSGLGGGDNESMRSGYGGDNKSMKSGYGGDNRSVKSGHGGGDEGGNRENDGMSLRSVRTAGRGASNAGGGGGSSGSNAGGGGSNAGGTGDVTNAEVGGGAGGGGGDDGGGGGGGGGDGGGAGGDGGGDGDGDGGGGDGGGDGGAGGGNEAIPDTQSVKSGKTNKTKSVKSPSIKEADQASLKGSEKAVEETEPQNQDLNEEVGAGEEEKNGPRSVAVTSNVSISRAPTIISDHHHHEEEEEGKARSMITVENGAADDVNEVGSIQYSSNSNDGPVCCLVPSVMNKPGKWVRIGTAGFQFIPT